MTMNHAALLKTHGITMLLMIHSTISYDNTRVMETCKHVFSAGSIHLIINASLTITCSVQVKNAIPIQFSVNFPRWQRRCITFNSTA